jgi:hypothetical protein
MKEQRIKFLEIKANERLEREQAREARKLYEQHQN